LFQIIEFHRAIPQRGPFQLCGPHSHC
jgi:hypothetical protein